MLSSSYKKYSSATAAGSLYLTVPYLWTTSFTSKQFRYFEASERRLDLRLGVWGYRLVFENDGRWGVFLDEFKGAVVAQGWDHCVIFGRSFYVAQVLVDQVWRTWSLASPRSRQIAGDFTWTLHIWSIICRNPLHAWCHLKLWRPRNAELWLWGERRLLFVDIDDIDMVIVNRGVICVSRSHRLIILMNFILLLE